LWCNTTDLTSFFCLFLLFVAANNNERCEDNKPTSEENLVRKNGASEKGVLGCTFLVYQ